MKVIKSLIENFDLNTDQADADASIISSTIKAKNYFTNDLEILRKSSIFATELISNYSSLVQMNNAELNNCNINLANGNRDGNPVNAGSPSMAQFSITNGAMRNCRITNMIYSNIVFSNRIYVNKKIDGIYSSFDCTINPDADNRLILLDDAFCGVIRQSVSGIISAIIHHPSTGNEFNPLSVSIKIQPEIGQVIELIDLSLLGGFSASGNLKLLGRKNVILEGGYRDYAVLDFDTNDNIYYMRYSKHYN